MIKFIKNSKGLTLVEIMIAVAMFGGVALMSASLLQTSQNSSQRFEKVMSALQLEKNISGFLLSHMGCEQLVNKSEKDELVLRKGVKKYNETTGVVEMVFSYIDEGILFKADPNKAKLGVIINSISIDEIKKIDDEGSAIAVVKLILTPEGLSKSYSKNIIIPVVAEDKKVISCNADKLVSYNLLNQEICDGLFEDEVSGTSCTDTLDRVLKVVSEEICTEITGSASNFISGKCDFSRSHADKSCASEKFVNGFDSNGELICI